MYVKIISLMAENRPHSCSSMHCVRAKVLAHCKSACWWQEWHEDWWCWSMMMIDDADRWWWWWSIILIGILKGPASQEGASHMQALLSYALTRPCQPELQGPCQDDPIRWALHAWDLTQDNTMERLAMTVERWRATTYIVKLLKGGAQPHI